MRTATQTSPLHPALAGIVLSGAVAWVAMRLGDIAWLQNHGFSALTVAIVLGIILGNTVYARMGAYCGEGVRFSKQTLLRAGIILYGFRLTFQDIAHVGISGVVIDAVRCAKLGLDRRLAGPLLAPASYFMKSPPEQYTDAEARERTLRFIEGDPRMAGEVRAKVQLAS